MQNLNRIRIKPQISAQFNERGAPQNFFFIDTATYKTPAFAVQNSLALANRSRSGSPMESRLIV